MRTLNELYLLLWEMIKDENDLCEGLCYFVFTIYKQHNISYNDERRLLAHMKQHKPINLNKIFWFPDGEKGTKQRKEFVLSMIEKTKQQ